MKQLLITLVLIAGVSSQIYTKIQKDGYHYDRPDIDVRLNLPMEQPKTLPTKPESYDITQPSTYADVSEQTNFQKQAPTESSSQPLSVKLDILTATEEIPTLPPLPSFIPQINLPKILRVETAAPPKPLTPEIQKPAPFSMPRIDANTLNNNFHSSLNEYLPPVTSDYLPPVEDLTVWEQWKKKFNKRYADIQEDRYRESIFDDNVKFINLHNDDFRSGKVSSDCSVNKFADLTIEEFIEQRTGLRLKGRTAAQAPTHFYEGPYGRSGAEGRSADLGTSNFEGSPDILRAFNVNSDNNNNINTVFDSFNATARSGFSSGSDLNQDNGKMNIFMDSPLLQSEVKEEIDWRKEGAITPVKDQGKCASCWAFSANGALEAHNFLKKRTGPIPLSEQNLIDCVKENDGCDGGYMTNAYIYAMRNPGVDKESTYQYEAKQSKCRFMPQNVGGDCMSHMEIQIGNEKALEQAVASVGPVSAGIDAGQRSFQFYKSGYYYEPKCEQDVNHAVLIVGYGKTDAGEEYWICKNSWDTDWGEEGYIRMAKNKNNNCGITNLASYPIV